jgi:hypothetical protein
MAPYMKHPNPSLPVMIKVLIINNIWSEQKIKNPFEPQPRYNYLLYLYAARSPDLAFCEGHYK